MRLLVLTSISRGFASLCLPKLAEAEACTPVMVVLTGAAAGGRWRRLRRKAAKTLRIGALGAINGVRMRRWYGEDVADRLGLEPIEVVASRLGVRLETSPSISAARTAELFDEANADLGLTLGTGYVPQRLFSKPTHGMINVHHELLPRYRGALSVVWQIHDGSTETGYTIHRLTRSIDAGEILDQQRLPIDLRATLRETVTATVARLYEHSAARLPEVIDRFEELSAAASPQAAGSSYTTPTFAQYRRMVTQHARLLESSRGH